MHHPDQQAVSSQKSAVRSQKSEVSGQTSTDKSLIRLAVGPESAPETKKMTVSSADWHRLVRGVRFAVAS